MLAAATAGKAIHFTFGMPLTFTIYSDVRGKYPAVAAITRTKTIYHTR